MYACWLCWAIAGSRSLTIGAPSAPTKGLLAVRPDLAKLHNGRGVALLRLQRFEEAFASFQAAIRRDPDLAEAHFNAGILLEHAERLEEAAGSHLRAARLDGTHLGARVALGGVLQRLGRVDEAAAAFEAALAIHPGHLPALGGLFDVLERGNRLEGLARVLERARGHLGDHPLVRLYEGMVAAAADAPERSRTLLESVVPDTRDPSGRHRERRRLSRLVRVCDTLGDEQAALAYAAAANDLSRRVGEAEGVRKETFLGFVANRRRATGAFRPAGSAEPLADRQSPVFLVGFPRSGTTLLDTLLRGHPDIRLVEESDAVGRMVTELCGPADERLADWARWSRIELERARRGYLAALAAAVPDTGNAATVIDRFALNIVYAGEIHQVFPAARFVLMLRHPADCVLSCYLQTFEASSANASFFALSDAAHLYDRVFDLWMAQSRRLDLDVTVVRYEDLVQEPAAACCRLLDALGLPWHPGILDHRGSAARRPYIATASYDQVVRPLYGDARGRWQRYRRALAPVLPVLAPWIRRLGYSEGAD